MARLSRSLSLFNSATILPVSKVLSSGSLSVQDFDSASVERETKGSTSSHERSGFAIVAIFQTAFVLAI
jgi:hypothetical protein